MKIGYIVMNDDTPVCVCLDESDAMRRAARCIGYGYVIETIIH